MTGTPKTTTKPTDLRPAALPGWAQRLQWWMELRIGIIPLPVYLIFAAAIWYFVEQHNVAPSLTTMIPVVVFFGFTCAEIGNHIPFVRSVGGAAIFATFLPSALVYYHLLPDVLTHAVTDFTNVSNYLYLYVTAVVVGSVFGIDRAMLIRGLLKILAPLAAGTVAAILVGTAVGAALGLGALHSLFYLVVPVMAGGVGEGALPLALGYSSVLHLSFGSQLAQVLPTVMVGSFFAILAAGALNLLGKKRPHLTGNGRLQPGEQDDFELLHDNSAVPLEVIYVVAAALTALSLYLLGMVAEKTLGLPAPVLMLFLAIALKLSWSVTRPLQRGAEIVFQVFAKAGTYPLLFMVGVAITPWDKLIAALAPANLITIAATVVTIIGTGFFVGRMVNLHPIEAAIVNATHAGQGGAGGVAILDAAERMELMPFAQIAIRVGGAIVVTLTLLAFARIG